MPELQSEGYEFFGFSDRELRAMLIERIEFLMANKKWSRGQLASHAHLPRSSVYAKLDREADSQFTFSDLCAVAKAFDISILQLFPLSDYDRKLGGKPVAKASMLKMWDSLLARNEKELTLLAEIDQVIQKHLNNK
ncbi:XRE family transcriptional regulator [Vibrio sinaloensis]|uniref:XRE family transcriptional regulator n=1 Tax=Photobacterium sp. (strain ATCC 43367) TaxID=379097 RepID=UPI002058E26C|nr:XRE family transcriptional regulator [Vibrio sinaloensis]UPQ89054.1 XRE family transcriptional regulator [Vibrio sinaloensis]